MPAAPRNQAGWAQGPTAATGTGKLDVPWAAEALGGPGVPTNPSGGRNPPAGLDGCPKDRQYYNAVAGRRVRSYAMIVRIPVILVCRPHGMARAVEDYRSDPIAPMPWHKPTGSRRAVAPSIPPRAATGIRAVRANRDQRTGPSAPTSGWLEVGYTGDRKARLAPACLARRRSAGPCAELVTRRHLVRP